MTVEEFLSVNYLRRYPANVREALAGAGFERVMGEWVVHR